jgi:hypothetical protein
MIECEEAPINTEFGASERSDDQEDHRQGSTASAISTNKRTSERAAADQEREVVFRQIYTDHHPIRILHGENAPRPEKKTS